MIARMVTVTVIFVVICAGSVAQETCDQSALDSLDNVRAEHSGDISALFVAIDDIKAEWQTCTSGDGAAQVDEQSAEETLMSASEVVDGGHIVEGLWQFTAETINSDACTESKKKNTYEFFEDVYYNDDGLLVWDAGSKWSNFTFEYLVARRYSRSEQDVNWVWDYELTDATEATMAGRIAGYWQGNKHIWCSEEGTFTAELFDTENACLVDGEANIRSNPSAKSPTNGKIDYQRRVIGKARGDDGYFWWQLSDDEYVREDVVTASRSCERL